MEREFPHWMRDLWFGPIGQEHGEEGLTRSALRKYSRQINSSLAMISQVSNLAVSLHEVVSFSHQPRIRRPKHLLIRVCFSLTMFCWPILK